MSKTIKRVLIGLAVILVVLVAGFVIWGSTPSQPMPEALQALQSDSQVTVTTEGWTVFQPADQAPTTGLIIYPGGRVDYRAYAPLARAVAEQGYLVVLAPMPLSLAVFNPGEAADVIKAYPEIKTWAVAGHSLGGAMAANYAAKNPDQVDGLVLWAAYPADSDSLVGKGVKVISIYGSEDGLATGDKIQKSHSLLPTDTEWMPIEGGNHAQFGWYGPQSGDGEATISREDQQAQIAQDTIAFLKGLSETAAP
jgi:hypothetical protein